MLNAGTRGRARGAVLGVAALAAVVAGCAPADNTPAATASAGGSPAAASCEKSQLKLVKPGTLTIGTDKPAFEPWFKDDNPANGQGFEGAVAAAVAGKLGFAPGEVTWTTVGFNQSFAPGPKAFDFDINQISISDERKKAVDFSEGYYTVKQAVVANADSPAAKAKSLADLKNAKLGAQVGTTSLSAVEEAIKPAERPRVYDNQNDVVSALKNKQVEAVVVDLPTAFYVTAAQVEGSKIVGQFQSGGQAEEFGLLFQKGNPLVTCVNKALGELKASGELAKIEQKWIAQAGAPELK
ncbi:ABC transporter substrate-binding protein [Bailinhaonella thermotolerans]|uniref:Amino acid ABC transporter substrate-binding protein n=1 Tax=Bailinhaonella thermotolerans TaxID=1070861 RepID=A0A3A4B284_9ACTN|nr:ABC transporter substrate-binding protein [Bailinhaonella thermotolerans]RJL32117.1 amino acid ABC transporter substrate-binding protein [Bailinhaonella thermotolerans]